MKPNFVDYNQYGERLSFFECDNNPTIIQHSDLDDISCYYFNFPMPRLLAYQHNKVHPFLINEAEEKLIEQCLYKIGGAKIELKTNIPFDRKRRICLLTYHYCPACLTQREKFDVHHVIWKMDGGHDHYWNLIYICSECHAVLTSDSSEGLVLDNLIMTFMSAYFGLLVTIHGKKRRARKENSNIFNFNRREINHGIRRICAERFWLWFWIRNQPSLVQREIVKQFQASMDLEDSIGQIASNNLPHRMNMA